VEELIPNITEALDTRLKEIGKKITQIQDDINQHHLDNNSSFTKNTSAIADILNQICRKIE